MKSLSQLEKHVDSICRNEKYSDYEKKLHIMTEVVIPLHKELHKAEKEVREAGWEREAAHADDWRKVHEMGC